MTNGPHVTNVDDRKLTEWIWSSQRRIVFLAPGLSLEVASTLADAWTRLGRDAVNVILDVDAEVCRLGYGTLEGVNIINATAERLGGAVCHQPGVRIGVLIADDRTLIYSPTPLLIEAESSIPERPNAVEFTSPPATQSPDLGLGPTGPGETRIGSEPLTAGRIASVQQDLQSAPAVRFDLARRVRVFTSQFQFVELGMTGCFISRKRIPVPSRLVGLGGIADVERSFHAHFDLVRNGQLEVQKEGKRSITERSLLDGRREIERKYLVTLTDYGSVVLRANKDALIKAVEELREEVATFSAGVTQKLEEMIESSRKAVVEALLPAVERNPPAEYTKTQGPSPTKDYLRQKLEKEIERAFGRADELVERMEVKLIFKDVAYESLIDGKFLATARKAMPDVKFLHEEFQATPASEETKE
jgi:hypothetical protein